MRHGLAIATSYPTPAFSAICAHNGAGKRNHARDVDVFLGQFELMASAFANLKCR